MSRYRVMIHPNLYNIDLDERYEQGDYLTAEEAIAECQSIVDEYLLNFEPGNSANDLYESYLMYGDEPYIVTLGKNDEVIKFSAQDYAKERCQALASGEAD